MSRDFWASLTENSSSQLLTAAMDTHLSGKAIGESFEGVRALSDAGRAKQALSLPVEVGTRVAFTGGLGAVLTYENPPETGSTGTVVHVKRAGGNLTSHGGKVFVSWDDGHFLPVHAEHLRLAGQPAGRVKRQASFPSLDREGKEKQVRMILDALKLLSHHHIKPKVDTDKDGWVQISFPAYASMAAAYIENHLDEQLGRSAPFTVSGGGNMVYIDVGEDERGARYARQNVSTVRVASLGDLTSFFTKVGSDTLIHKSTHDLWSLKRDAGGYVIERLFDDNGGPLKG